MIVTFFFFRLKIIRYARLYKTKVSLVLFTEKIDYFNYRRDSIERLRQHSDDELVSTYACACGQEYGSEEFLKRHQVYYKTIHAYYCYSFYICFSKLIAKIDQLYVHFVKTIFHQQMNYVIIYFYVEIKLINVQSVENRYDVHILLIIMRITVLLLMK